MKTSFIVKKIKYNEVTLSRAHFGNDAINVLRLN